MSKIRITPDPQGGKTFRQLGITHVKWNGHTIQVDPDKIFVEFVYGFISDNSWPAEGVTFEQAGMEKPEGPVRYTRFKVVKDDSKL